MGSRTRNRARARDERKRPSESIDEFYKRIGKNKSKRRPGK